MYSKDELDSIRVLSLSLLILAILFICIDEGVLAIICNLGYVIMQKIYGFFVEHNTKIKGAKRRKRALENARKDSLFRKYANESSIYREK